MNELEFCNENGPEKIEYYASVDENVIQACTGVIPSGYLVRNEEQRKKNSLFGKGKYYIGKKHISSTIKDENDISFLSSLPYIVYYAFCIKLYSLLRN